MSTRRHFVKAAAGGAVCLGLPVDLGGMRPDAAPGLSHIEPARRPLRLLILGGTGFTGPHQVRYAVARGHTVTLFNRGRRQAERPARGLDV